MTIVVDTSILIDVLRGMPVATDVLREARRGDDLHGSEITRLEVLAGMRASEEFATRKLLSTMVWHPVDERIAEVAGELGRRWLRSTRGIDSADLGIAATAILLNAELLTKNVKHFPMFTDLTAPY